MSVFHFQVRTGSHILMSQGAELTDLDQVRIEAARRAGEHLAQHAEQLWEDEEWQMDVTDTTGLILFTIQISAFKAAATQGGD